MKKPQSQKEVLINPNQQIIQKIYFTNQGQNISRKLYRQDQCKNFSKIKVNKIRVNNN